MKIKVCNSGSSGNGYAVCDGNEVLLLEAGCRFMDIKIMLDFNISNIKGMCISHIHTDHYAFHKDYEVAGIQMFKPWEEEKKTRKFGGFLVQAFPVEHDVECFGFYITTPSKERIVFITDSFMCKYNFQKQKPTVLMTECNYTENLIEDSERKNRVFLTHFGLNACNDFVSANLTDELKAVILLHLSDVNADQKLIEETITKTVGDNVFVGVADKNAKFAL